MSLGPRSTRRIFDDKFLFSAFLAGIGISTPTSLWIVLKDVAVSPGGQRISRSALVSLLGSGRWFVKPRSGSGGHGAFLLDHGTATKAEGSIEKIDLLKLFKAHESFLVQDVVVQSEDYAAFSPSSLNTVRCLTYLSRTGDVEIAAATLRMGSGRSVVDNASSGGIYCGIDLNGHPPICRDRSPDTHKPARRPNAGLIWLMEGFSAYRASALYSRQEASLEGVVEGLRDSTIPVVVAFDQERAVGCDGEIPAD